MFFSLLVFLKQGLAVLPGWPQTCSPPSSTSYVLGLQLCATIPDRKCNMSDFMFTNLLSFRLHLPPSLYYENSCTYKEVERIVQWISMSLLSFNILLYLFSLFLTDTFPFFVCSLESCRHHYIIPSSYIS
jgi:hypothetical protein